MLEGRRLKITDLKLPQMGGCLVRRHKDTRGSTDTIQCTHEMLVFGIQDDVRRGITNLAMVYFFIKTLEQAYLFILFSQ